MRRSYDFDEEREYQPISSAHRLNMHPVIETEKPRRMFSRGQIMSMIISLALLIYAYVSGDVPLIFLLLSFLIYLLRPLAEKFAGPWLGNAMKGFAFALGIGAVVLAFL